MRVVNSGIGALLVVLCWSLAGCGKSSAALILCSRTPFVSVTGMGEVPCNKALIIYPDFCLVSGVFVGASKKYLNERYTKGQVIHGVDDRVIPGVYKKINDELSIFSIAGTSEVITISAGIAVYDKTRFNSVSWYGLPENLVHMQ